PPPRHAVHHRLRIPGLREGDDSPLWTSFRQAVRETYGSQRLPTQRLRRCEPNDTSRTRSRHCAYASASPSPADYRDAHAAQLQYTETYHAEICDAVVLGHSRIQIRPLRVKAASTPRRLCLSLNLLALDGWSRHPCSRGMLSAKQEPKWSSLCGPIPGNPERVLPRGQGDTVCGP